MGPRLLISVDAWAGCNLFRGTRLYQALACFPCHFPSHQEKPRAHANLPQWPVPFPYRLHRARARHLHSTRPTPRRWRRAAWRAAPPASSAGAACSTRPTRPVPAVALVSWSSHRATNNTVTTGNEMQKCLKERGGVLPVSPMGRGTGIACLVNTASTQELNRREGWEQQGEVRWGVVG